MVLMGKARPQSSRLPSDRPPYQPIGFNWAWPQCFQSQKSRYHVVPSRNEMLRSIVSLLFAAVMWVQVPQWSNDWSKCAVDVPDTACHWYVVAPDNTFGEGFSWANAPWFSAEGLLDIGELTETMSSIHLGAVENA